LKPWCECCLGEIFKQTNASTIKTCNSRLTSAISSHPTTLAYIHNLAHFSRIALIPESKLIFAVVLLLGLWTSHVWSRSLYEASHIQEQRGVHRVFQQVWEKALQATNLQILRMRNSGPRAMDTRCPLIWVHLAPSLSGMKM
jgi:hypothetical protein